MAGTHNPRRTYFAEYQAQAPRYFKDAANVLYVLHADSDDTFFFSIGDVGEETSPWLMDDGEVEEYIAEHKLVEFREGQVDPTETFAQD